MTFRSKSCQHYFFKACIKPKITKKNKNSFFVIIPDSCTSFDWFLNDRVDPIHKSTVDIPFCWRPITAIDYVSFGSVQTRPERSQRDGRHSYSRLSLLMASSEATTPSQWWICTSSKCYLRAVFPSLTFSWPIHPPCQLKPMFGQCALPISHPSSLQKPGGGDW